MANELRVSYRQALKAALPYFSDFWDKKERIEAEKDGHTQDWVEWQYKELRYLACDCCTAEEMVGKMFGVSDERVHNDLMALRAKIGAKHEV